MTKAQAQRAAARLVAALGPSWRSHIWENLGWHAEAVSRCGRVKVPTGPVMGLYRAYIGIPNDAAIWWIGHGCTPAGAVRAAVKEARAALAEQHELVDGLPFPRGAKRGR